MSLRTPLITAGALAFVLAGSGCIFVDSDSDGGGSDAGDGGGSSGIADSQDDAGNLLIINDGGHRLVLFKDEVAVRAIPNSGSDFLINIPNAEQQALDLQIFKESDVTGGQMPEGVTPYKRWKVILGPDTAIASRRTWHISSEASTVEVGVVSFNYYGGTENNVEVYLNGRTGAKLLNIAPGHQYRETALDFGIHTLLFRYWKSDPNDPEGATEVGWTDKEIVMGNEEDIYLVLNEDNDRRVMVIPHFGASDEPKERHGVLRVVNNRSHPLTIHVGNESIETYAWTDGSRRGLSNVAAGDTQTYRLEALNSAYQLRATDIQGREVANVSITIDIGAEREWVIGADGTVSGGDTEEQASGEEGEGEEGEGEEGEGEGEEGSTGAAPGEGEGEGEGEEDPEFSFSDGGEGEGEGESS